MCECSGWHAPGAHVPVSVGAADRHGIDSMPQDGVPPTRVSDPESSEPEP